VQNQYNIAYRHDDALIDRLAGDRIAYVRFFRSVDSHPFRSSTLSDVADSLGATPTQVALAWLLRRAPYILLIPGTSSLAHLRENLAAAELNLPDEVRQRLGWLDKPGWQFDGDRYGVGLLARSPSRREQLTKRPV